MSSAQKLMDTSAPAPSRRPTPLMTPSQRTAMGRQARSKVPRSTHADVGVRPADFDPIALLEQQAAARVPELVPIRYGRMLTSAFAFFRGAALIMAQDLARLPESGISAQLCGDAHLSNFGLFATPERRLVFDLNDFDETFPGPVEWDVKRLAASLEIAARHNGLGKKERRGIVLASVARYRAAMRNFAKRGNLDVWYAGMDAAQVEGILTTKLKRVQRGRLAGNLAKARTKDNLQALGKLAARTDGEYHILSRPPLIVPISELLPEEKRNDLMCQMEAILEGYGRTLSPDRRQLLRSFHLVDVARKVVGVGSVGTRAWILLLTGRDALDPLILQAKEAQRSVLDGIVQATEFANQGERVVAGQKLMQAASDLFLGWERVPGFDGRERDFYVRQLRDWKGSAEIEDLLPSGLRAYGEVCGWTLARAHARSGDRIAIAAYLGRSAAFDDAVAEFAASYADRNEQDYQRLRDAARTGRVVPQAGL